MRDIGHEIAPDLFQAAQLGDVVHHDKHADRFVLRIAEHRRVGLENCIAITINYDVALSRRARRENVFDELSEIAAPDARLKRPAAKLKKVYIKDFFGGMVHTDNFLVGIDGDYPFSHA